MWIVGFIAGVIARELVEQLRRRTRNDYAPRLPEFRAARGKIEFHPKVTAHGGWTEPKP